MAMQLTHCSRNATYMDYGINETRQVVQCVACTAIQGDPWCSAQRGWPNWKSTLTQNLPFSGLPRAIRGFLRL